MFSHDEKRFRILVSQRRHGTVEEWHNGADVEIDLYASSLHRAAKLLVQRLDPTRNAKAAWDAGPIILLYRQAVELRLKALVGKGAKFLQRPADHITLCKTHSLRWLAQIVCQIIETVQWQADFKCEGISTLAEFRAPIAELDTMDPFPARFILTSGAFPKRFPTCFANPTS